MESKIGIYLTFTFNLLSKHRIILQHDLNNHRRFRHLLKEGTILFISHFSWCGSIFLYSISCKCLLLTCLWELSHSPNERETSSLLSTRQFPKHSIFKKPNSDCSFLMNKFHLWAFCISIPAIDLAFISRDFLYRGTSTLQSRFQ